MQPQAVLDVGQKQKVSYVIPLWLRDEQIKSALRRPNLGRLQPMAAVRSEPCAIVGYGPSLRDTWKQIRKFKWVFSCSGAHRFLIDRGIIPNWHVAVDPLPEFTVKLIGEPHPKVEYLIASTCHPDVFDHLANSKVTLWHILAQDGESERILPKGEWHVTGGCDVGLRSMTLAAMLGFRDLHIFGIDGSAPDTNARHAAQHPNSQQAVCTTNYRGRVFQTTPAMLEAARQVFNELDQMPTVKATFYGDALIQSMAKDYVRRPIPNAGLIALNEPELISDEMRRLNAELHHTNLQYGVGGGKHTDVVKSICEQLGTTSVLDYGAGKQYLAKALPFPIWSYDPAVPEISELPRPADLVVCTDVLEHVEPERLKYVLNHIRGVMLQCGYFVVHNGPARKTYANGQNTHLIQQSPQWWEQQLTQFFEIGQTFTSELGTHFVVAPKKPADAAGGMEVTRIEHDRTVAKFVTPNDTTKWRANTLITKEPATIEWIETFKAGEVLWDVGANVGGYSVWAANRRGVKVVALEPEADNYALLVKNLRLNKVDGTAYCVALTDQLRADKLYLSQLEVGGSCHSFAAEVGPDLGARPGIPQGALGVPLDMLAKLGLPTPDHIKIDVDGLEHLVIKGGLDVLSNGVKSVLCEVNGNLAEHTELVQQMTQLGFSFDSEQVERARRKDGPFEGCAEYVFTKQSALITHLLRAIENAPLHTEPFPHLILSDIWPADLYGQLRANLPKKYHSISKVRNLKGYPQRSVAELNDFWQGVESELRAGQLISAVCEKFGISAEGLTDEVLLIRDKPTYAIGPHTDSTAKVISALFYLAGDEQHAHLGTSIYRPRAKKFTCEGGPHYPFAKFQRVQTVPYLPNTAFIFLKTNHSFHGVEPTDFRRDVLLYDVRKTYGLR